MLKPARKLDEGVYIARRGGLYEFFEIIHCLSLASKVPEAGFGLCCIANFLIIADAAFRAEGQQPLCPMCGKRQET